MTKKPSSRVCLVTSEINGPSHNGGIGTAFSNLASTLVEQGSQVTVLFTVYKDVDEQDLHRWVKHFKDQNIDFKPLIFESLPFSHPPRSDVEVSFCAYHWLKQQDFNIIHFHDYLGIGCHSLQAKHQGLAFADTTICVQLHGNSQWIFPYNQAYLDHYDRMVLFYQEQTSVELADVVISPSQFMLDWCQEQGWSLPADTHVLPNLFPTQSEKSPFPTEPLTEVVFFGRLEARKGLDLFCHAIKQLPQTVLKKIEVTFLGSEAHIDGFPASIRIHNTLKDSGIKYQQLTDYSHEEANDYINQPGRLVVIPSLSENSPYTVLECLELNVPFIASQVGGIPELVDKNKHTEILFRPNPHDLAKTLKKALTKGLTETKTSFSMEENRADWIELHKDLGTNKKKAALSKSQSEPRVSVCLVHFNRPHLLKHAIASIEAQTYKNIEVILVDDGSKDKEAIAYLNELEKPFAEKGWKIIRSANHYLGAARNKAARAARGTYLKFMDDDNIAKPHEIATFVQVAEQTKADIITSCSRIFDGNEGVPDDVDANDVWIPVGPTPALGVLYNSFGDANALIRKSSYEILGGMTEDYGVGHEDWEFFAKAILNGMHIERIPEDLFYYRVSQSGMLNSTHQVKNHLRNIRPYLEKYPELADFFLLSQGHLGRIEKLQQQNHQLRTELATKEKELKEHQKAMIAYTQSTSWKVTKPMRWAAKKLVRSE